MATTIADLVVKIGADISGFKGKVKELEGEYSNIVDAGKKLQSVGATMTTYVTAPLLAAGAAAVTMAANVDKGISEVVTLFGLVGDEAQDMTDQLKKGVAGVSSEVGIAQSAITEGLYDAISAGIPEENVFDFMTVAAKASVAGVTDIRTAVDGITTSINAYGLSAADAERVSDSMFAAVQGGKTTFGELSQAIFQVGPSAKSASVSMEEINAAIATLTASGVPTSNATIMLKNALVALQRPSEELDKIFKKLGYESAQVAIESKGLGFALDAVKKASNGNNGELTKLLSTSEAVAAAQILAGSGAAKFAQELDRQSNAAGSTQKAFDTMAATVTMQMQKTMVMMQNIAIAIGDKLLPIINAVLLVIQDLFLWFSTLSDGMQNTILVVLGIVAAIGPLLYIIGTLSALLPTLGAKFALLTGPIGLTVLAIAAVVAGAIAIYNNWEGIVDWFEDMWFKVKMIHLEAADKIIDTIDGMFSWIPGSEAMFEGLRESISNAIDAEEVSRRAVHVERSMENMAKETAKTADGLADVGKNSEEAGNAAVKAADSATKAQEEHRKELEAVNKAIENVVNTYLDNMSAFDREVEIGIRIADNGQSRLLKEIEVLTRALTQAASDVNIDLDSEPIVELRQRLQEARGELMTFRQGTEAAEISIRSMTSEIDDAKTSLSSMSRITGEAIAASTWRQAKDAVTEYKDVIVESGSSTEGIADALNNYMIPALNVLTDSTSSAGDKFNALAQIALSAIPGIGGALAGLLGVMDKIGLGLDDLADMFAGVFRKSKPADNAAEWFKEVNRLIKELRDSGLSNLEIISDLKILFPNISEATLKALVEGTEEAFAEYNKWLADPKNKLLAGSEEMGKKLMEALASGLSEKAAIEKVLTETLGTSHPLLGVRKQYEENLSKILEAMKKFGVMNNDFFGDITDPAELAAIELEGALLRINDALTKNIDTINEKLKAGIITQEMADTSILKEYERAISDMFEAGLKADDPRLIAMINAWKTLGGGAKGAAEDTEEATDAMAEAIKKQAETYAATLAKLAKLEEDNAALIALGVKTQADSQKEILRAYTKAIEDLVDAGLKSDDPRLISMVEAWKSLGGSVEDTTEKVKQTVTEQEKAAAKLQQTYDTMALSVAKQMETIRASWESGATDGLTAMQQEALLLRDSIESLLRDGMNPNDERLQGWQSRLNDINQNMKDLGLSTYEVIDPTDRVALAWRKAGDSLVETLDHIEKRNIAGLFSKQTDMLREQANAYKKAIEDFLKSGDPNDPRIQGWLESLRLINERLADTGETVVELRDKFEIAADAIREKLDEKLGNIEYDMKFNFDGSDKDLDVQIEKTKAKMKALNDAIIAAGQAGFDKQDDFVKDLIATYQGLFEKLNELEWQKTQEGVTDMFEVTAKKLAELDIQYKLFGDTSDYLAQKMKLLKEAINKMIQEGIDPEDDRLLELSEQYKEAAKAAELYAESQRQIKEAIKDAIGVGPDQDAKNTLLMKLGDAALELWGRVDTLIRQTSGEAVLWLSGWSASVLDVFKKALQDSQAFREKVIAEQMLAFDGTLQLIQTAWNYASEFYDAFVKRVKFDLQNTLAAIHNTGLGFATGITDGMGRLIDGVDGLKVKIYSIIQGFSDVAKIEFDKTLSYAEDLASAMGTAFASALNTMRAGISDLAKITVTFNSGDGNSNPPALANGGLVYGPTMALVGDNMGAGGDPEVISPLSKLNEMLVQPALNAISSLMGAGGGTQQVIYVNLDGRTLAESTFYNLPDVVRMHTGGLR